MLLLQNKNCKREKACPKGGISYILFSSYELCYIRDKIEYIILNISKLYFDL